MSGVRLAVLQISSPSISTKWCENPESRIENRESRIENPESKSVFKIDETFRDGQTLLGQLPKKIKTSSDHYNER